ECRTEQRMLGGGDVTDGEDIGIAGTQRRIDEYAAVAQGQARPFGKRDVGGRTDGDEDGVGVDGGPVVELQPGRFAIGDGDFLHGGAQPEVDTVFAVQRGEYLTALAAERAHQRQL